MLKSGLMIKHTLSRGGGSYISYTIGGSVYEVKLAELLKIV